jgi:hypothetical protein
METKKHLLHSARINNNCPECFSTDGLEFSFSQNEKETQLYRKASQKIEEVLFCHSCGHTIYPVNWNDDIERVYSYHKKLANPQRPGYKLKPLAYLIILIDLIVLGVIIYLLITG